MKHGGLRIAVIGSRGIPARYGGFETFAQELSPRLVERGHEVTVYCRRGYTLDETLRDYRGVALRYAPALSVRTLEQLSHELASIIDSIPRGFQLYYFLGYRGAPFYVPIRGTRRIVVVHTDGLEWKRRKWNRLGRSYLRVAEAIAARAAADELVADSHAIADYFRSAHGAESTYLTHGAYVREPSEMRSGVLRDYGLEPGSYYAVVCRIEPENNVDTIIPEFISAGSGRELVVVGGMNYRTPYWDHLQRLAANGKVHLVGPVYGEMAVESMLLGAYGYIHGHEVGGTNPVLLTAMGCGKAPLALDTPFNVENLAGCGRTWTKEGGSLAAAIQWADAHSGELDQLGAAARERIRTRFSWEQIADAHDWFFRTVADRRGYEVELVPAPTDVGA